MPYLHLDLSGTYPVEVKRELAALQAVRGSHGDAVVSGSPSSARAISITSAPTGSSPSPWSWSSFVAVARRKSGWH
jgi:hypothetical protein